MVTTRTMALTRQESNNGSDMDIVPNTDEIPTITNIAQNETGESNILAIQPQNPTEPTLLEIVEPDVTFEALS